MSRDPVGFVRFARAGSPSIVALLVAAMVGAADVAPTPAAPVGSPTIPAAPPAAGTPSAGAAAPAAPPTLSIAESSARRALCDSYVAVIAGRRQDAALLEKAEVQALAMQEPDVATCGAVAADSDAPCRVFVGSSEEVRGNRKDCIGSWSLFHELRAFPKGRGYMFDEALMDDCRHFAPMAALCEPFRDALRSGDPERCANLGALQWVCRAYVTGDPSLCRVDSPDLVGLDKDCRSHIDNRALYRKGLKAVAASGSPRERVFAQAALGARKACAAFDAAAKDRCVAAGQPPTPPPPPPPPTPDPSAATPADPAASPAAPAATPAAGTPAPKSGVG